MLEIDLKSFIEILSKDGRHDEKFLLGQARTQIDDGILMKSVLRIHILIHVSGTSTTTQRLFGQIVERTKDHKRTKLHARNDDNG